MTTTRTMCPMNCHPTLCGMLVEGEENKVVSVRGDPDSRGQAAREVFDNPGRLLYPLVRDRREDPFRRATWDAALERITTALSAHLPQATAIWPGHGTFTTNYGTRVNAQLFARFANFHGSQFFNPTMICWGLGAFGLAIDTNQANSECLGEIAWTRDGCLRTIRGRQSHRSGREHSPQVNVTPFCSEPLAWSSLGPSAVDAIELATCDDLRLKSNCTRDEFGCSMNTRRSRRNSSTRGLRRANTIPRTSGVRLIIWRTCR